MKRVCLRELQSEPVVLFTRREAVGLFDQIISACQREKIARMIFSQPGSKPPVVTEVAAGLGVSVVPGCVRRLYTKGCMFIPIEILNPSIPTVLYYRSAPPLPIVANFVKLTIKAKPNIQGQMLK